MMNYLIAFLILATWSYIAMNISWNSKYGLGTNLFAGFGTIVLIGIVHWIPFWLIFLR